jgi:hypothetical protein
MPKTINVNQISQSNVVKQGYLVLYDDIFFFGCRLPVVVLETILLSQRPPSHAQNSSSEKVSTCMDLIPTFPTLFAPICSVPIYANTRTPCRNSAPFKPPNSHHDLIMRHVSNPPQNPHAPILRLPALPQPIPPRQRENVHLLLPVQPTPAHARLHQPIPKQNPIRRQNVITARHAMDPHPSIAQSMEDLV